MPLPKTDTVVKCDVLIVGGGLAGCMAAVAAKEAGADRVVLVDKGKVGKSGQSPFAAGIYAAFDPSEDDFDVWMQEMVSAGEYLNDQEWVRLFLEESFRAAVQIQQWSAEYGLRAFELTPQGKFIRRRSRGHIHTWHLLQNSLPLMETMRRKVRSRGVTLVERTAVIDLLIHDNQVTGALGISYRDAKTWLFLANGVVISSAGAIFRPNVALIGRKNLTGDLQAISLRRGVVLANMENSSSNTHAKYYDCHGKNLYVGVGGKFLNAKGEEFMWRYDPVLGNRARLQTLALAFCREVEEGRGPICLDTSAASREDRALCRKILPEAFKVWDKAGVDLFEEKIEWVPSFHGTTTSGGGIRINVKCETNISGLYAAGDVTNMPCHGTYTFGGVCVATAAVSGKVAGREAGTFVKAKDQPKGLTKLERDMIGESLVQWFAPITRTSGMPPDLAFRKIASCVVPYEYCYLTSRETLEEAQNKVLALKEELPHALIARDTHELVKANEALNLLQISNAIISCALFREESRGWRFRKDFPLTDNVNWLKWILVQEVDGKPKIWAEPVPTPYVKPPQESYSLIPGVELS